jgi:PhnB protein
MKLNPYLHFKGDCADALKFYAEVLGGKILMMLTHAEAPPGTPTPPDWTDKIMHGRIEVNGDVLMGSDAPPGHYHTPAGYSVSLNFKDPDKADRVYAALSEGGIIHMAIQETFWAHRFAMFADKFGTPWMINCEKTP